MTTRGGRTVSISRRRLENFIEVSGEGRVHPSRLRARPVEGVHEVGCMTERDKEARPPPCMHYCTTTACVPLKKLPRARAKQNTHQDGVLSLLAMVNGLGTL